MLLPRILAQAEFLSKVKLAVPTAVTAARDERVASVPSLFFKNDDSGAQSLSAAANPAKPEPATTTSTS
jgi:hypothetical protein